MKSVWLLIQESNVDGEIIVSVTPFSTEKKVRKALDETKREIITDYHHYKQFSEEELKEYFTIDESENGYFIEDNTDDYYECLRIEKKNVL